MEDKMLYVDLGLPSGNLWSTRYESGPDPDSNEPMLFSANNALAEAESYLRELNIELPSKADVEELIDGTSQVVDVYNGETGIKFISKYNGRSVFMRYVHASLYIGTHMLLSDNDDFFAIYHDTGECFISGKFGKQNAYIPVVIIGVRHKKKKNMMPSLWDTVFKKLSLSVEDKMLSETLKCWSPVCGSGTACFKDGKIHMTPDVLPESAIPVSVKFDEFGRLYGYPESECLLFPAKGKTNWKAALSNKYIGEPVLVYNSIGSWDFGYWQEGHRLMLRKGDPEEDWWEGDLDCYFMYAVPFYKFDPQDPYGSANAHSII